MANDLSGLLQDGLILAPQTSESRKEILCSMANAIAEKLGLEGKAIFEAVIERENLGSTGVGHLRALAQVSRTFRNTGLREALRSTDSTDEITGLLCPKIIATSAA